MHVFQITFSAMCFPFRAIQKGSFLGADTSIDVGIKTQSFAQGCCSGEGFFILKASGAGRLLISSYVRSI